MEININAMAAKLKDVKIEEKETKAVEKTTKSIEPRKMIKAEELLKQIKSCKNEMKKQLLNELINVLPQEKLDNLLIILNYLNIMDKKDKDYVLTKMIDSNAPVNKLDKPVEVDFKQLYALLKNGVSIESAAKTLGLDVKTLLDHVNKYEKQLKDFKFFQQNKTDALEYLQFRIYQTLDDDDLNKISAAQRITMLGILQDKVMDSKKLGRSKLNIEINLEQIQEQKKKAFIEIKGEVLE